MSKQVKWTADTLERFITYGLLDNESEFIMRNRCKNMPITRMAMELNRSESWVHKRVAYLKKLYDEVQRQHPDEMPVRKASAKETWMDEN